METTTLWILLATAATVGFVHTITGPDHYIPFIAMSRVGCWSLPKTLIVTLACGAAIKLELQRGGHVSRSAAML